MSPRIAFVIGAPVLLVVGLGLAALVPSIRGDAESAPATPAVGKPTESTSLLERQRGKEEDLRYLLALTGREHSVEDEKLICGRGTQSHLKRERQRQQRDAETRDALRAQVSDPVFFCRALLTGSILVGRAPTESDLDDCRRLLADHARSRPPSL
jgi:hypothetical protein